MYVYIYIYVYIYTCVFILRNGETKSEQERDPVATIEQNTIREKQREEEGKEPG